MTRAIAGIFDCEGVEPAMARRIIPCALAGDGSATVHADSTYAIGVTDSPGDRRAGGCQWTCLLDGVLQAPERLASLVGLDPGVGVEALIAIGYDRIGDDLLAQLRGDFALVLISRARREVVLVRDQLGVRSLCLHSRGARLTFASEVRQLLALLPVRPAPDPGAISHWLGEMELPSDRTFYERVRRLEPAHALRANRDGIVLWRYWQPRYVPPGRVSRAEAVSMVRHELERAVAERLPSDADVGVTLSGGLDSSSVAAIASGALGRSDTTRAYSAVFPRHASMDESALIDQTTAKLGIDSTRAHVEGGSVLAGALEYLAAWQLPPSSPNVFFWLPMARRARADGLTTLLDGEGGDELFNLSPYLMTDRLRRGRVMSALRLADAIPGPPQDRLKANLEVLKLYGVKGLVPASTHEWLRRRLGAQRYVPSWLDAQAARRHAELQRTWSWKHLEGPRWWAFMVELTTAGTAYDHIRRRADLADVTMRHPLWDVDLLELMLRLPPELAYDRRYYRPLLRESVAGLLPDNVRLRAEKSWFDELFCESIRRHDLGFIRSLLDGPNTEITAFVRREEVRRHLLDGTPQTHPLGWRAWARQLLMLAVVECWLRAQTEPDFPSRVLDSGKFEPPRMKFTQQGGRRTELFWPLPTATSACTLSNVGR